MQIGDNLTHSKLINFDNKQISTHDYAHISALLLVVTCNHCPYARAYWNRLIKIHHRYKEESVQIIAINGNNEQTHPADSFGNMQKLATDIKLPFPYLHNPQQNVLIQLAAQKTPEVFLFNSKRQLVYKGAIDDNWENENAVTQTYLQNAIEHTINGLEVDCPETNAVGCSIKWL